MNIENKTLRIKELEVMTSQQLDELLHRELEKDTPDSEVVMPILHILEERDAGNAASDVDVEAVWKVYQEGLKKSIFLQEKALQKDRKPRRWLGRVAAIAAIVCLLVIAVPTAMGTENIFEILGRWTQTIFEFFNPTDATEPPEEYAFKTDHPGLQRIYDAVVEQGVAQPVVPQWIPEGFVLAEVKTTPICGGKKVCAALSSGEDYVTFAVEIYNEVRTNQYTKDENSVDVYEKEGVKHYIMSNEDALQAVWLVDNIECMILTNCERETLHKVIRSIYTGR